MTDNRFIIAGASKAGTEWLLASLREHPEVFAPQGSLDFFSRYYDRGVDWYNEQFTACGDAKAVGEKATSYIIFPDVPERIHAWDPSVKLLFVLRDPVARAYSHYCMLLRAGEVSSDVRSVLKPGHMLVEEGLYYSNLQRFYKLFNPAQCMIRLHDDLTQNDADFLKDVLTFIGVDADFEPKLLGKKLHVRKSKPKSVTLFKSAKGVLSWINRRGKAGEAITRWLRMNGPADWFHRLNRGDEFPAFTDEHKRELAEYYREDTQKLAEHLGRDLSHWQTKYEKSNH